MSWALLLHDAYHDDRAGVAADDDEAAKARRDDAYALRARLRRLIRGQPGVIDDQRRYQETEDDAARHDRRVAESSSKAPAA